MEYQRIRSGRKTIAIQVAENGEVIVSSPFSVSRQQVERFLEGKREWIEKTSGQSKSGGE